MYTPEEQAIVNRELRFHELTTKLRSNRREFKAMMKEYQRLKDERDQGVFLVEEEDLE